MPLTRRVVTRRPRRKRIPTQTRKYVKAQIKRNKEKKFVYLNTSGNILSYDNAYLAQLNNISTGTSDNTRVGDELKLDTLSIKGDVSTVGTANTISRVIAFQWYSNSTPTITDVLQALGAANDVNTAYNDDNLNRMKILYDKRHSCIGGGASTGDKQKHLFNIKIKGKKWGRKKCNYISGSATATTNGLYLMAFSNASNASGNGSNLNYAGILKYTE